MIENFTKIIERIEYYNELKELNFNQLAIAIGVSNSYFSKMVKNKGSLGEDIIKKILLFYDDINPEWLLTGQGSMLKGVNKDAPPGGIVSEPQAAYGSDMASLMMRIRMLESEVEGLKRIIEARDDQVKTKNELIEALREAIESKATKPIHK